ncbi:sensor histidine kinase [Bacteroidota bacterium]
MNEIKRHHSISLLMLISIIMLSIFIIRWLIVQYDNEKILLENNLHRYYSESQGEIMDTLLIEHIIIPHMDSDSLNNIINVFSNSNAIDRKDSFRLEIIGNNIPDTANLKSAIISVHMADSVVDVLRYEDNIPESPFALDEMLIRSTRLFFHYQGDTSSKEYDEYNQIMKYVDTSLFKRIYDKHLEKNGINLTIDWQKDSLPVQTKNNKYLIIASDRSNFFPPAFIKKYRVYLLKKISPQIIFALILLIFTGAAFYLAHSSLRKQIMLNKIRKDFIRNMTHELKTPVATVKLAVEAMRNEDISGNKNLFKEYLKMSAIEIERLEGLIDKALKHSMLEDNADFLNKEEFDFTGLIKKTINYLKPLFHQENANVNFTAEDNISIFADPVLCQGILVNIIDNSLKYAGPNPEISIELRKMDSSIVLQIRDKGPGIPIKYQSKIFDEFFRIPTGDIHNIKGYGLGLSFVSLVMKQHKGEIKVKNRDEGGCEFKLIFPENIQ